MSENTEERIPLAQERARLEKRVVERSRLKISTRVAAHDEVITDTLRHEEIEIIRVPVDKEVEAMPTVRQQDDVTVIPIVEERLVVTKQLVLVEELHVRRKVAEEDIEVPVTLHSTHASVERTDSSEDENS